MNTYTSAFRQLEKRSGGGILPFPVFGLAVLALLGVGLGLPVIAQDLGDDDNCMACHEAFEWSAPEESETPRVHNDDGTPIQQVHEMWSCTDCHEDIAEIPHREDTAREVDCLSCHETIPEK